MDTEISAQDLHFGDYTTSGSKREGNDEPSKQTTPAKIPVGDDGNGDSDDAFSDSDDKANLLNSEGSKSKQRFWSFEYYQSYFDVETHHVLSRIYASIILNWNKNFIISYLRPNPDLYGPFWIATTLVFSIAVNGNFSSLVKEHRSHSSNSSDPTSKWAYDLDKMSTAGLIVSLYLSFVPTLLWVFLRWRKALNSITLLEIVCVYGYSLSIFIPASVLWLVPVPAVQWSVAAVAFIISATCLVFAFWPSLENEDLPITMGIIVAIVLLHGGLAISFMFLL